MNFHSLFCHVLDVIVPGQENLWVLLGEDAVLRDSVLVEVELLLGVNDPVLVDIDHLDMGEGEEEAG